MVGRFAMVADPGGAAFYLLTPLPQGEEPTLLDPATPGKFSWHELYSSLGDKAPSTSMRTSSAGRR